jgi:drug/metabolite transporter (DMT)-like permease
LGFWEYLTVPQLLLSAVLALTVYGQLIIKARALAHAMESGNPNRFRYLLAMLTDPGVISGVGAAAVAAVLWILAIERLQVGYAYPFMALSFVLVPLGAMALFGERMPPTQFLGLGLIVSGVIVSALAR